MVVEWGEFYYERIVREAGRIVSMRIIYLSKIGIQAVHHTFVQASFFKKKHKSRRSITGRR